MIVVCVLVVWRHPWYVLYLMMLCLCSASWHKWSTSLVLMVDGNGQGLLGTTMELELLENDVYSKSLRIMQMCLWSPPPFW